LVELVICLLLLGVVLLAAAPLFLGSRASNDAANRYAGANFLVRERLEQLMSVRFDDPRLAAGFHADDLPPWLPDPATGEFPSAVPNPFRRTYRVRQFAIPSSVTVARGSLFVPRRIRDAGARFDYKRIDVTVETSLARPGLGLTAARVSEIRPNPAPEDILSEDDPEP
jgi:Tfp pilus assembly protein PilV